MSVNKLYYNYCLLCGKDNPLSLKLRFASGGENKVITEFTCKSFMQGYDGILHGGVIMALLDSAMTNCIFQNNSQALTARMSVQFVQPIPANATIVISAEIVKSINTLFVVKSKIENNNELMATAEAKFIKFKCKKE